MEEPNNPLKPAINGVPEPITRKRTGSTLYSEDDAGPTDPQVNNLAQEALLKAVAMAEASGKSQSWLKAHTTMDQLKPVPWFIWRLCNQILGRESHTVTLLDSNVMGLRRLLFAAASSSVFGKDTKVNSVREALLTLKPDVVAAVSVIHATVRKMQARPFDLLWRPLLDEALLRGRIGFEIGRRNENFGGGRGLLAGFASYVGLPMLMSVGTMEEATKIMEALSQDKGEGADEQVYGTSSLQVGAMYLSACGVSSEAANGFIEFANSRDKVIASQHVWASCAYLTQMLRNKKSHFADQANLDAFSLDDEALGSMIKLIKQLSREGHGISWIE